ncbi:MAG: O-antigen ligase family protein, partial [Chloroflexota bacterium]
LPGGLDPVWPGVLDKGGIFATWGLANAYAGGLVLLLPLVAARAAVVRGRARWAHVGLLAAGLLALVWTGSRGGWLGAVAACAVALVALGARVRAHRSVGLLRPSRRSVAVLGVLGLAVVVVAGPALVGRLSVRERAVVGSVAMHVDLWAVGIRMAQKHPVTGIGLERYVNLYRSTLGPAVLGAERTMEVVARNPRATGPVVTSDPPVPYRDVRQLRRWAAASPHSVPVAIAAGAGFPALALYVALFALVLVAGVARVVRGDPRDALLAAGALAAVSGHLVTDLFVAGEPAAGAIAWLLAGALAARGVRRGRWGGRSRA